MFSLVVRYLSMRGLAWNAKCPILKALVLKEESIIGGLDSVQTTAKLVEATKELSLVPALAHTA